MAAPKGNKFWQARSSHGCTPVFPTPQDLWQAATEYFEWVEENPLYEDKVGFYQGMATHEICAKMRAMTLDGLTIFLDIGTQTWYDYKAKKGFSEVTSKIERIIRDQKFSGAAADLLNASIIARDLGLADKKELTGANGDPIKIETMSPEDAYKAMLEGGALSK